MTNYETPQPFRGANRAQGYIEEADVVSARDIPHAVPQMGDTANNASESTAEQRLAQFRTDSSADAPTTDVPAPVANAAPIVDAPTTAAEPPRPAGVPNVDLRMTRREAAETSRHGWRGVLRNMGLAIKPSAAETRAAELGRARSLIRLSQWQRSVGILVANPKGGVGKTPLSLAIGGCFATIRGGGAVVVEVADDPGALSVRAEGRAPVGVAELLRDIEEIRGAGHLAGYVSQQTSYAAVIGTVGDRDALTGEDVHRLTRKLDEFYPVRVMDTGNQPSSSAFHGALEHTDVLVIPVLDALDALQGAMQLLRHLHQLGGHAQHLAQTAIVVRTHDGRPEDAEVSRVVGELLEQSGIQAIHHVPVDRHIAERAALTYGQLAPATTDAITRLTAGIVDQLNTELRKAQ